MAKARKLVVGAPPPSDLEFALQVQVPNPDKAFEIELPGSVVRVGKAFVLGILPLARIVTRAGAAAQVTTVAFGEKNARATDKALASFDRAIQEKAPKDFRLIAESATTFAGLAEAASTGRRGKKARAGEAVLRLACRLSGGRSVVSDPFPGVIAATSVPSADAGPEGEMWQPFDCHSHWWRLSEKEDPGQRRWFTVCHGPCSSGGPCGCGTPSAPRCWGVRLCWC